MKPAFHDTGRYAYNRTLRTGKNCPLSTFTAVATFSQNNPPSTYQAGEEVNKNHPSCKARKVAAFIAFHTVFICWRGFQVHRASKQRARLTQRLQFLFGPNNLSHTKKFFLPLIKCL